MTTKESKIDMSELKLQETEDGELFFNIPDNILERLGWEEGDEIKFVEQDGGFLLKKVKYESVSLDIDDEDLLKYMTFAHERNITFNELCQNAIKEKLDELET
jgi:bifunctional DNA-binding transcriptional regulator/antitoxin component of YhaV-PrlF toxin-antitoxin module